MGIVDAIISRGDFDTSSNRLEFGFINLLNQINSEYLI